MKTALITGVTGQDGSLLAEFLLGKGYEVHGIKRRSSLFNTQRVDHLYADPHDTEAPAFKLHFGDLTDSTALARIISAVRPDEIYNLGAQSHVAVSFEMPEYTADVNAVGTLRLLEAIRMSGLTDHVRFYQASSSEIYGDAAETPQRETTPFRPRSPYAAAKLYAYWMTVNFREAYDLFACNGILFNHESPLRGETFVTRKITLGLARVRLGLQDCLYLGNLDARRDWGHARDYVRAQWMMLQHPQPDDYVIASGHQYSVRDFVTRVAKELDMPLQWQSAKLDERAIDTESGRTVVRIDERYFRPTEVDSLLGDASKAREALGWEPEISFDELVREMVAADLHLAEHEAMSKREGFRVFQRNHE